jgi:hypothetical protein
MIIIEGPDGAGKSTLISSLMLKYPRLKMAPRPCTSLGGPLAGKELAWWLEEYGVMPGYLYDRHQCISGPVYDAVLERPVDPQVQSVLQSVFYDMLSSARVIYCRPPRAEIVRAISDNAQLDGVARKIHEIISTYDALMCNIVTHERYDWTRNELPSL